MKAIVTNQASPKGATLDEVMEKAYDKLNAHYGKLKRGIDGVEYQKKMRNEWD